MRNGMTLMSVMVAVALAGVVALAVARLLGNQSKTMAVVRLREQREHLLKHYKNIVVSGWDATRSGCGGAVCTRQLGVVIPSGGLYLADQLYEYNYTGGTAGRWWQVTTEQVDLASGGILQSDQHAAPEDMVAMRVKVDFMREEHPTINVRLAPRQEIVFLHHNTASALTSNITQCGGGHRTQVDASGSALYVGSGALTQYDFISNYSKCSQVPLIINDTTCGSGGDNRFEALLGFFRGTGSPENEKLVTGSGICSIRDRGNTRAAIRNSTEKRTVQAIDCRLNSHVGNIEVNEVPSCANFTDPSAYCGYGKIWDDSLTPERCRDLLPGEVDDGTERSEIRVAARSVPCTDGCDCLSKPFTLRTRIDPGGDGRPAQYEIRHASGSNPCTVHRRKGIHSFKTIGEYWPGMRNSPLIDFEDSHGVGRGPRGPTGEHGLNNGPPGPPGPRGRRCRSPCPTPTP